MDPSSDVREHQIAAWIGAGKEEGFASLLREYGGRVRGYLRQRFPSFDDHAIYEVLGDAALAVAATFDPQRGSLAAWFLFLAHQQAVGMLRCRGATETTGAWDGHTEPADRSGTPLDELVAHERLQEVQQVLTTVSALERSVIEADLEEGGPVPADILAARLHTTEGSVYAARQRARRKLIKQCSWIRDRLPGENPQDGETTLG